MLVITRKTGEATVCVQQHQPLFSFRVDHIGQGQVRLTVTPNRAGAIPLRMISSDEIVPSLPATLELDEGSEISIGNSPMLGVRVVMIKRDRVRFGFEASDDVEFHRLETWQQG